MEKVEFIKKLLLDEIQFFSHEKRCPNCHKSFIVYNTLRDKLKWCDVCTKILWADHLLLRYTNKRQFMIKVDQDTDWLPVTECEELLNGEK